MSEKAIIGVLAAHEVDKPNDDLVKIFQWLLNSSSACDFVLENYQFVITGGTYERCFQSTERRIGSPRLEELRSAMTVLPTYLEGGVVLLSYMVVQRQCSILWPFLSPTSTYLQNPDNGALLRIADYCHAKKLMNPGSVRMWVEHEAKRDQALRNRQRWPLCIKTLPTHPASTPFNAQSASPNPGSEGLRRIEMPTTFQYPPVSQRTIALIAHDGMKDRMVDFAVDYEGQLAQYSRVLATGTTGRLVVDATRQLESKLFRCYSGPKGGDIEIAVEVLAGKCHDVVFFIDPVNPHPHMDDIKVVIGACMVQDDVQMLTNERHARAWMDHIFPSLVNGT